MTLTHISPAWNYTFQIPNEESVMELMYAHLLLGAVAPVRPAIEAPMRATDATKRNICSMEKADDENKAVQRTRWAEDDNKAEEPKKAKEEQTDEDKSAVMNGMMIDLMDDTDFM